MTRARRKLWERSIYIEFLRCRACDRRIGQKRLFYNYFDWSPRCPCCGTADLERRTKADRVDRLLCNPFRLLQRLAGGAIYHCEVCRVQFHDLRQPLATVASPAVSGPVPANRAKIGRYGVNGRIIDRLQPPKSRLKRTGPKQADSRWMPAVRK